MHDDEGTDGNNSLTMTKIRVIPTKTKKATHTAAVKTVTKRAATTIDDLDLQKTLKLLVMTHISADVLVLSAPFRGDGDVSGLPRASHRGQPYLPVPMLGMHSCFMLWTHCVMFLCLAGCTDGG